MTFVLFDEPRTYDAGVLEARAAVEVAVFVGIPALPCQVVAGRGGELLFMAILREEGANDLMALSEVLSLVHLLDADRVAVVGRGHALDATNRQAQVIYSYDLGTDSAGVCSVLRRGDAGAAEWFAMGGTVLGSVPARVHGALSLLDAPELPPGQGPFDVAQALVELGHSIIATSAVLT